jgi:aldehyde:ferredoxin oxidoreductase
MLKVGERAMAMARVFNQREGFTPQDDVAHWRFATPMPAGAAEGVAVSPETMADALNLYYEMRGWDKQTGAPTKAKLYELGLGWLVD